MLMPQKTIAYFVVEQTWLKTLTYMLMSSVSHKKRGSPMQENTNLSKVKAEFLFICWKGWLLRGGWGLLLCLTSCLSGQGNLRWFPLIIRAISAKIIYKKTAHGMVTFWILFETFHFNSLLQVTPRLNFLVTLFLHSLLERSAEIVLSVIGKNSGILKTDLCGNHDCGGW